MHRLGKDNVVSGTSQTVGATTVSQVLCTDCTGSSVASESYHQRHALNLVGFQKPNGGTFGKLRVTTWNKESITGRSREKGDKVREIGNGY